MHLKRQPKIVFKLVNYNSFQYFSSLAVNIDFLIYYSPLYILYLTKQISSGLLCVNDSYARCKNRKKIVRWGRGKGEREEGEEFNCLLK